MTSPDRRRFLATAGGGAGLIALAAMESAAAAADLLPHRIAKARRVIWLFMHGGPSHVDLFDDKPALTRYAGQPLPASFGSVMTRRDVARNPLLGPQRRFRPRGQSGLMISEFLPHMAECVDDLCVIRSVHGRSVNHPQSVYEMNTGRILMGSPSVGSWVAWGLGSDNHNLPAFVVLPDPGGGVKGGPPAWGHGYLPASSQGVTMRPGRVPVLNLEPASPVNFEQQQRTLSLIQALNSRHRNLRDQDDLLAARIESYELAFRMQMSAPELADLHDESPATLSLYGVTERPTEEFGRRCLLARRLIERGVRFVQVYSGDTNGWDAHNSIEENHSHMCLATDKPVAGLLKDLKQRGLLDDTLVIWGGEFGRMPMSEQGAGRDHNPWGYTVWLAGAGVRPGFAWGATDDVGLRAAEDPVSVSDLHATILDRLGLDHETLAWYQNGLDNRLTGPGEARVVREILA